MNLKSAIVIGALTMLIASSAAATGGDLVIDLRPLSSTNDGAVPSIDLTIAAAHVSEVDVETAIIAADETVGVAKSVGVSVLDPSTTDDATRRAPPPGFAVVGKGDTLRLPSPHVMNLSPGIYAEQIDITVVVDGLDTAVEEVRYRYFEITKTGLTPISMEEWSERVLPFMTLADGRRVIRGGGLSPTVDSSAKAYSTVQATRAESTTPPSVVPALSEVNER